MITKLTDEVTRLSLYPILKKPLDKIKPKIVINTNFSFTSALHKYCRWKQVKVINIIANPRQLIPNEIYAQAEFNTVFDDLQKKLALDIYPRSNIIKTGWFVRERFEQQYDKKTVRKKLKLKQKSLTFLFVSGYEGTEGIATHLKKLVNKIKDKNHPLQIIVACGKNDFLLKRMQWLAKRINKNYQHINLIALPFTKKIHAYMQAADLVIGKAGPNTLFEAVATKTPFLATTHVHGLEEGSLELINDYKLGFVEENPNKMVKLLTKITKKAKILDAFKPHLEKLANTNKQAKKILVKKVKKLL